MMAMLSLVLVVAGPALAGPFGDWQSTAAYLSRPGEIGDMVFYDGDLYASGRFPRLDPDGVCYLARYDGVQWTAVNGVPDNKLWARLLVFDGLLYLGASFDVYSFDGVTAVQIEASARLKTIWQNQLVIHTYSVDKLKLFDGAQWSEIALGLTSSVKEVFSGGGELFVETVTDLGGPCWGSPDLFNIHVLDNGSWISTGWFSDRPVNSTADWQGKAYVSTGDVYEWFQPFRRVAHFESGAWVDDINSPGGLNPAGVPTEGATTGLFEFGSRLLVEVGSSLVEFDGLNFQAWTDCEGGTVEAVVPSGADWYMGGDFRTIGGTAANGFALHSGSAWSAPSISGTGLESAVSALGWIGDELLVATTPLDDYGSSQVFTSTLATEDALAEIAHSESCRGVDVGQCQTYYVLECSETDAVIRGLADFGGTLFALGEIVDIDGVATGAVARWNGLVWSAVDHDLQTSGAYVPEQLFALREVDGTLWMGGYDTTPMIQQFDGSRFNDVSTLRLALDALGPGCDYYRRYNSVPFSEITVEYGGPTVFDLAGFAGELVLGTDAGLVSWDGSTLDVLDQGWMDTAPPECCIPHVGSSFSCPQVRALAVDGDVLYAGGWFGTDSDAIRNVVRYEGGQWLPLGTGLDGRVNALVARNGYLIAGGSFTRAGALEVNGIALWDGTEWHALDGGINDAFGGITVLQWTGPTAEVRSLLLDECGNVFVGGSFVEAGGLPSSNLAIWSAPSILSSSQCSPTGVIVTPPKLRLSAAPNPFNPATEIRFDLPRSSDVQIGIFDLAGRRVRSIEMGTLGAGTHSTVWRGRDDGGRRVSSGVYVVRLSAGAETRSLRVVLLK